MVVATQAPQSEPEWLEAQERAKCLLRDLCFDRPPKRRLAYDDAIDQAIKDGIAHEDLPADLYEYPFAARVVREYYSKMIHDMVSGYRALLTPLSGGQRQDAAEPQSDKNPMAQRVSETTQPPPRALSVTPMTPLTSAALLAAPKLTIPPGVVPYKAPWTLDGRAKTTEEMQGADWDEVGDNADSQVQGHQKTAEFARAMRARVGKTQTTKNAMSEAEIWKIAVATLGLDRARQKFRANGSPL